MKEIAWTPNEVNATQFSPSVIEIKASLTCTGKQNFTVHHDVVYTINGKGVIKALNDVSFSDPKLVLARLGVPMFSIKI